MAVEKQLEELIRINLAEAIKRPTLGEKISSYSVLFTAIASVNIPRQSRGLYL